MLFLDAPFELFYVSVKSKRVVFKGVSGRYSFSLNSSRTSEVDGLLSESVDRTAWENVTSCAKPKIHYYMYIMYRNSRDHCHRSCLCYHIRCNT